MDSLALLSSKKISYKQTLFIKKIPYLYNGLWIEMFSFSFSMLTVVILVVSTVCIRDATDLLGMNKCSKQILQYLYSTVQQNNKESRDQKIFTFREWMQSDMKLVKQTKTMFINMNIHTVLIYSSLVTAWSGSLWLKLNYLFVYILEEWTKSVVGWKKQK